MSKQGKLNSKQQQFHLLVVEDDPADSFELMEIFENNSNYIMHHTDRLKTALAWLREDQPADLILLDLYLPDGYGVDMIGRIRSIAPDLPIIVLTGLNDEQTAIKLMKKGAQDYFIKGAFDYDRLTRAIRYAIERQKILFQAQSAQDELAKDANFDTLTGLPNRKLFLNRLETTLKQSERYKRSFGLLFVDLDGFKQINDTLGHDAGDVVLKAVAEKLTGAIRVSDTASRYGGDEFTIILHQTSDESNLNRIVVDIRNSFRKPIELNGEAYNISASIGAAIYPFDGMSSEELLQNADKAMYEAKSAGKNCYRRFNIRLNREAEEIRHLLQQLQVAISNDEMLLHYQPLIDLEGSGRCSLEALVRWKHPQTGDIIYPDQFIPVAEENGLMNELGEWVLHRACNDCRSLQDEGHDNVKIAVNLSGRQFMDKQLHRRIILALDAANLGPQHLGVEVTETCAMSDIDHTISMLKLLQDIGIQISIDDFGTGYSSLSYLKKLPADYLKIDRSFIEGVASDAQDHSITSAIIAMAHRLRLQVVAEGVESDDQLSCLKNLSCNLAQGYHLARPLGLPEIKTFLTQTVL